MTASSESPERSAEWNNASIGDTVTLDGTWPCPAESTTTALCTRGDGHEGQHVATAGGVVIEVWPS